MQTISLLTICGIPELAEHQERGVTHVLSILDPEMADPDAFSSYGPSHRRTLLRFHDAIEPAPGVILPEPEHVETILGFGRDLAAEAQAGERHLLVHCHAGISRSTAAMTMLLAEAFPDMDEDELVRRLEAIRDKAWPNSRMIGFADEMLGRGGRLVQAVRRLHGRQLVRRPEIGPFMRGLNRSREVDEAIPPAAA